MPASFGQTMRSLDMYGHEFKLKFDKEISTYQTKPGGICSIWTYMLVFWLFIYNMYIVFTYGNSNVSENITGTNYKDTGVVDLERLNGILPFYRFKAGNSDYAMLKNDKEFCAPTDGDCYELLKILFNIDYV